MEEISQHTAFEPETKDIIFLRMLFLTWLIFTWIIFYEPAKISLREIILILPSANINPGGDFVEIDIWHSFSFKLKVCISIASIKKNDGLYLLTFYNFGNLEMCSFFLANNISEKSEKIYTQLTTAKMFQMSKRIKVKYSINVSWPGWLLLVSAQAAKQSIVKGVKAATKKCSLKLSVPKKRKKSLKKILRMS